jgi:hypothetical protein
MREVDAIDVGCILTIRITTLSLVSFTLESMTMGYGRVANQ